MPHDVVGHEVFCAVKRPFRSTLRMLQKLNKVTVFDVVDFWTQPEDGERYRDLDSIRSFFRGFVEGLPVDGVIFPNRTMFEDLGDRVPNPTYIYHHYRLGMEPIEIKERPLVVGYEGEPSYLGRWRQVIESVCSQHGMRFVVNPSDLCEIDIGFAARDGRHASVMSHRYKSNVKLVNLYGGGIPCVVNDQEMSYKETDSGEVRFFSNESELSAGIAELIPSEVRRRIQHSFLAAREQFTLPVIGQKYESYFAGLLDRKLAR